MDICGRDRDLEGAERVGLADHRVGAQILGRNGCQIAMDALVVGQGIDPALHAGQHPQGANVDLHELQRVDLVLGRARSP